MPGLMDRVRKGFWGSRSDRYARRRVRSSGKQLSENFTTSIDAGSEVRRAIAGKCQRINGLEVVGRVRLVSCLPGERPDFSYNQLISLKQEKL
jgi:hypothetical protein